MPNELKEEEMKRIFKEAMKEWLDEKFADFGKWSAAAFAAAVFAALALFVVWANGIHK